MTIWVKSRVSKVLFEGKKAIGVKIIDGISAYANKEVILCAGTMDTPKLLLLPGVVPRAELEAYKIQVVHDLPGVGKNLQDHCLIIFYDLLGPNFSTRRAFANSPQAIEAAHKQWSFDKTGRLVQ